MPLWLLSWIGIIFYGAVEIVPPHKYETLYHSLEECVGTTGEFERIEWYGALFIIDDSNKHRLLGVWFRNHRIVLDFAQLHTAGVVGHEMLHDIQDGAQHDDDVFSACVESIKGWA